MLYLKLETWYKIEIITSETPFKVMTTDNAHVTGLDIRLRDWFAIYRLYKSIFADVKIS